MKKTIPKNVKKAFLVSSFMGSVLKTYNSGRPVLIVLHKRVNQGMRRFNLVGGRQAYYDLTNEGFEMWSRLSEEYSTKLTEDEIEIFVEVMGYLLSQKDYKDFLGSTQFKSTLKMPDIKYARVCASVIALGNEIDTHLNTKPCVEQMKTIKVKAKKERDVSRKQSKHEKEVVKAKTQKERKKLNLASLRDRAAALRKEVV